MEIRLSCFFIVPSGYELRALAGSNENKLSRGLERARVAISNSILVMRAGGNKPVRHFRTDWPWRASRWLQRLVRFCSKCLDQEPDFCLVFSSGSLGRAKN